MITGNRRIALNVVATYGRSLYALVCGLFTARWVLWFLKDVDFGLYGVIGGLAGVMTFMNGLLSAAVGRFYAYSVGEANRPGNAEHGLAECRRWFTTAVTLHTTVSVALVAAGYPIGEWAIRNFLEIPPDRVAACLWVWRWVTFSCFVAMVNVPFQAMFTAKQNIAELTIYSFIATTANMFVLYYMVRHPADWLATYAGWMAFVSAGPEIAICIRAILVYPECRISRDALLNWKYMKPVLEFAGCRLINGVSIVASNQGQAVVVNKYLGAIANATMTVGTQVSTHAQSLASSMAGALYPAITNAAGEGNFGEMRKLAMRASKFSALSLLVFMIPLALEMPYILKIWLVRPLPMASWVCVLALVAAALDRVTEGCWMAIFALGKIFGYQLSVSVCGFATLAIGWAFVAAGYGVVSVGISLVAGRMLTQFYRLYYGRKIAGMSVREWGGTVMLPTLALSLAAVISGSVPRWFMEESFVRVVLTTGMSIAAFVPSAWFLAFDASERRFVARRVMMIVAKGRRQ